MKLKIETPALSRRFTFCKLMTLFKDATVAIG